MTATSAVTLWAQCPTGMEEQFYFSDDGGARWTLISPVSQISGTGGAYFDPVSTSTGYLDVGFPHDDLFRITKDAHSHRFEGTLKCDDPLVFTTASDGLTLCGGLSSRSSRLLRTTDGGATWTRVTNF